MKRLVLRLLAVGVILGIGGISIMQGLGGSRLEDEEKEAKIESADTHPRSRESQHDPTPVTAIDAGDDPHSETSPASNGYEQPIQQSQYAESQYAQYEEDPRQSRFSSAESDYSDNGDEQPASSVTRGQEPDDASDPYTDYSPTTAVNPLDSSPNDSSVPTTVPLPDDTANLPSVDSTPTSPERVNQLRSNDTSRRSGVAALPTTGQQSAEQSVLIKTDQGRETAPLQSTGVIPADPVSDIPSYDASNGPWNTASDPSYTTPLPAGGPPGADPPTLATTPQDSLPPESRPPVDAHFPTGSDPTAEERSIAALPGGNLTNPADSQEGPLAESGITGLGKPGTRALEGAQTPTVTVEKTAPVEIQIGKPAEFNLIVRNVGRVTANQVVAQDQIPEGTRLISTVPDVTATESGTLYWDLGTMEPGEETTISMQLMPELEGEIGSVATVTFQATASVRTVATRPLLAIEHSVSNQVHVGDSVRMAIRVSNPGTGAVTNVVVEEDVPEGLSHSAGAELERELGTIKPGETKEFELTLKAEKAGQIENIIVARGDANLVVEDRVSLEVIAPEIAVRLKGPKKRYLEREVNYTLSVDNTGTAVAKNIELVAHLPKGMKFIQTNNAGQYDPSTHAVYWSLEELPAQHHGDVQLKATPFEPGDQKLRFEATADLGLKASIEQTVVVDGLASLFFEVADVADPIEVGNETTYEIRLVNEGSKAATGIVVQAILPPGLMPLDANGPERSEIVDQRVTFQPLARLTPGSDALYKVRVQGVAAGDQRFRVQVKADDMDTAISEEEATHVYADN